ncbi:hypothetical protein TspCOW1_12720 [Thiohalobacter sp. COW1]|nr:hypothetical protein TspCOW1_12720 [Thiohalobacter sp. COW1]
MKELLNFYVKALPITLGLIFSLTALSFLIDFTDSARLSDIGEEDFLTFLILAIVGIPTLLFGIKKLSSEGTTIH